jgi:hypothetical protein
MLEKYPHLRFKKCLEDVAAALEGEALERLFRT